MQHITYRTKLKFESDSDKTKLIKSLEASRFCWNECSKVRFGLSKNSIVELHSSFYKKFRESHPDTPAQLVIRAERDILSCFATIKSNKHKLEQPPVKKKLSLQLDKRLFSRKGNIFRITTLDKRINCSLHIFPKLQLLLEKYEICDPLIFVRNDEVYIALTFKVETKEIKGKLSLGVDLGIKRFAATSEGKIFIDRKYNKEKRKLRYLKRCLQSQQTKTAKKHLKVLRHKEANHSRNFRHHLANKILKTKADTIVLEDLKKIKKSRKQNKYRSQNRISQVAFFDFKRILTYKAELLNKRVVEVNPAYTSQTDSVTGKRSGKRQGCRFYADSGLVYDSDINAAVNIAKLAKLPVSCGNILDGQAVVNQPIVAHLSDKSLPLGCGS